MLYTQLPQASLALTPVIFGKARTQPPKSNMFQNMSLKHIQWDVSESVPKRNWLFTFFKHRQTLRKLKKAYKGSLRTSNYFFPTGRHFSLIAKVQVKAIIGWRSLCVSAINNQLTSQNPICDIKVAVSNVLNKAKGKPVQFKQLYLTNADPNELDPLPCTECFEFLALPIFPADTVLSMLTRNPDTGKAVIQERTVRDIVPLHKRNEPLSFKLDNPNALKTLTPTVSPFAQRSLEQFHMSINDVRQLIIQTAEEYKRLPENPAIKTQPMTACVFVVPTTKYTRLARQIFTAKPFAFSRRKIISPDEICAENAFKVIGNSRGNTKNIQISALAYYGSFDSQIPPLGTMGMITRYRGSDQTLITVVENGQWHIRTVKDYMPSVYSASRGQVKTSNHSP